MQVKNLLKKNSVSVDDGKEEVTKVVGTLFGLLTIIWCRHEAECLLKLAELGFESAPKLISLSGNSFTMEKIQGKSLHRRQVIDELLILRVVDVVRQLHALGFAHGNLRPNNILITDRNQPVLIDFETCCKKRNPLFYLARFSDQVRLCLLWQSRVVQPNQNQIGIAFPRYVTLVILIMTPVNRFVRVLKSIKKKWKRYPRIPAEQHK